MPDPQPLTDADRADLVAYLDGELGPDEQQGVEARLGRDPAARAEADTFKRVWELLDYLPRAEPSTDFTQRTLSRVSALPVEAVRPPASPPAAVPWYPRPALGYPAWAALLVLALAWGYRLAPPPEPAAPPPVDLDTDPVFAREPRLIELLPLYLPVETLDYLLRLDAPDAFEDDTPAGYGPGDE